MASPSTHHAAAISREVSPTLNFAGADGAACWAQSSRAPSASGQKLKEPVSERTGGHKWILKVLKIIIFQYHFYHPISGLTRISHQAQCNIGYSASGRNEQNPNPLCRQVLPWGCTSSLVKRGTCGRAHPAKQHNTSQSQQWKQAEQAAVWAKTPCWLRYPSSLLIVLGWTIKYLAVVYLAAPL